MCLLRTQPIGLAQVKEHSPGHDKGRAQWAECGMIQHAKGDPGCVTRCRTGSPAAELRWESPMGSALCVRPGDRAK
jgi:hypothetical protein